MIAWVGTASRSSGTQNWTIALAEGWCAKTIKIGSGWFLSSNPIDSISSIGGSSTNSSNVPTPSWSTTTAGGLVLVGLSIDADPCTGAPSGWEITETTDIGSVSGTIGQRGAATTASETITSVNYTCASDTSSTLGIVINGYNLTTAAYDQTSFRIRKDDGTDETDATWWAAKNVNYTPPFDENFRVRIGVTEKYGNTGTDSFQLQYRKNDKDTLGTWTNVTTSSSYIKIVDSTKLTDGDDTTEQLNDPGTFITDNNGVCDADGITGSMSFTASGST